MYYDMISMLNVYSLTDQILQNSLMLLGDVVGVFLLTPPFLFCFLFFVFCFLAGRLFVSLIQTGSVFSGIVFMELVYVLLHLYS